MRRRPVPLLKGRRRQGTGKTGGDGEREDVFGVATAMRGAPFLQSDYDSPKRPASINKSNCNIQNQYRLQKQAPGLKSHRLTSDHVGLDLGRP